MDISGISTSLNTQGFVPASASRGEVQPLVQERQADETPRDMQRAGRGKRGLALGILKQELRLALRAHFHARIAASVPDYESLHERESPDEVAEEALGAARQVAAESPKTAAQSLISFRAKIQETVNYVREITEAELSDDIEHVAAKVNGGLDEIENEVANYRETTASVLAVDTRARQRSTIQIRTQEGDVVRFSLKKVDAVSASDVAYADGNMSITSTEVAVSSRSRMMMSVEGDLNESELAAIQNVFAQAEMIADEFFGGDIAAAFNVAQNFEFDTEQLARVKMRFRLREVSNVAYTESVRTLPGPEAPVTAATEIASTPEAESIIPEAVAVSQVVEPALAEQPVPESPVATLDTSALESFLETLGAFLRSVGEGFAIESDKSAYTYHYSESFKLEMLKTVFQLVAPGDEMHAADNASTIIDRIGEGDAESA